MNTATPVSKNRVEVSTKAFEFAHGRSPRGRGGWLFDFAHSATNEDVEAKNFNGTFQEAKRDAVAFAAAHGFTWVSVCS